MVNSVVDELSVLVRDAPVAADDILKHFEQRYGASLAARKSYRGFLERHPNMRYANDKHVLDVLLLYSVLTGQKRVLDADTSSWKNAKGKLNLLAPANLKQSRGAVVGAELLGHFNNRHRNRETQRGVLNYGETLDMLFAEPEVAEYLGRRASYEGDVLRRLPKTRTAGSESPGIDPYGPMAHYMLADRAMNAGTIHTPQRNGQ